MTKTFTIYWDDVLSVGKQMNMMKSRYFELKRAQDHLPTKKERYRIVFDACQSIVNYDISHLYNGLSLDKSKDYYVYTHLDARKKIAIGVNGVTTFAATLGMERIPFYVGKGIGNRCFETRRSETHSKIVQAQKLMGKDLIVFKVREGLSESEALQLEAKLIDIFRLITSDGYLTNLDEGYNSPTRRECYRKDLVAIRKINEGLIPSIAVAA